MTKEKSITMLTQHKLNHLSKAFRFKQAFKPMLSAAALAAALPLTVQAQAQEYQLNIPAQPLNQALQELASKTGVQLLYNPGDIEGGLRSTAINGRYQLADSIRTIIQGTGLSYSLNGNTVTLQRASSDSLELSATEITSQRSEATTENTGSYTTGSMNTATKLPLSIRETPQSVSVITRQRMDDQGMTTLSDVVRNTTGLTLSKTGDERPHFLSRGFRLDNIMLDGLPIVYEEAALSTGLLSQYDRVEVVRGVSGLMEGVGSPGGSINLVRKRPTRQFQGSITAGAGSWDNYHTSVDLGAPLNEQGTLRGRGVIAYQDKNSFVDYHENKRQLLYGILEADLSNVTTLSFGVSYSKEDNPGASWNGMATAADGSFLPISRSHSMSPPWAYWDKQSKMVFTELEHHFANDWKAKLAATYTKSEMDMLGVSFGRRDDKLRYNVGSYNYDIRQSSFDGMLSGPFSLLGRTHELVIGSGHRKKKDHWIGSWPSEYEFLLDPLDRKSSSLAPNPTSTLISPLPYSNKYDIKQSSVYTTARFNLLDDLKLIVGGRLDWYDYEQNSRSGTWTNTPKYKATREFTPYAGLVYDLNDTYTAYVSWTRIFSPQNYTKSDGSLIDPREGSNYELGVKAEYFDRRVNASLAVFQINQENLASQLDSSQCAQGQTSCYAAYGEVRSRGIDMEVSGELTDGWQVGAGYTYTYAEILEGSSYSQSAVQKSGSRYGTNVPLNLFKAFTTYRLPGELNRWKIGGGVQTQSKTYTSDGVKQGGYTLVDLHASYTVNKNIDLSLNVNNLFDKRYYYGILATTSGNYFGDPRNYMLTARYKF
jgi:outer membrane receptor for ferric coprogen and ferric-rhodotorulic acid